MKQIEILQKRFTFKGDARTEYFCVDCTTDINLNVQSICYVRIMPNGKLPNDWQYRFRYTSDIEAVIPSCQSTLNGPYKPANEYPTLNTIIPDSMDLGMRTALTNLTEAIGGDVCGFVCAKLKMNSNELYDALKAEQIDGVALAIYNIEARHEGCIIGDQTGVGKGRQAAAVIRYAIKQGYLPIFVTQRANLFSDIYRDCKALGIAAAKPFILNSGASVVDFSQQRADYDEPVQQDGESDADYEKRLLRAQTNAFQVVYKSADTKNLSKHVGLPKEYDYIMTTYSQFNSITRSNKAEWLTALNQNRKCVFILDEAHTASGAKSNTGKFFQRLLQESYGVLFLSATFAKRPENMALYATKTAIARTGLDAEELTFAIESGGVPLQELVSNFLVENGQMIRRERDVSNICVRYITLDAQGSETYGVPNSSAVDTDNCDIVTSIMRKMVRCQREAFNKRAMRDLMGMYIGQLKTELLEYLGLGDKVNTESIDIHLSPVSPLESLFIVIESLLLAIKAKSIAELTLKHVREGKKVVICLSKTKESQIKRARNAKGEPCANGDVIDGGFKDTLRDVQRTLLWAHVQIETLDDRAVRLLAGTKGVELAEKGILCDDPDERKPFVFRTKMSCRKYAGEDALSLYEDVDADIANLNVNLPMSPIDYMTYLIEREGIKVGECTGRQTRLRYASVNVNKAVVESRSKSNVAATFARFQDNDIDVMIINQTGATGASCHAVPTAKVPIEEVKQRVMIIAQPELDINTEVQKRGRINRTGQLPNLPPVYEYISSAIPAEQRMMMMLKRKMKSLDANTSSNQKQNDAMLDYPDFQNKYGDLIVSGRWMPAHEEECNDMWLPIPKNTLSYKEIMTSDKPVCNSATSVGCANKVSGRIAILPCRTQEEFYNEVFADYAVITQKEKERGFYDIETSVLDIKGRLVDKKIINYGNNTDSFFGGKLGANKYEIDTNFVALDFDNALAKQKTFAETQLSDIVRRYEEYKTAKIAVFKQRQEARKTATDNDNWPDSFVSRLNVKSEEQVLWEKKMSPLEEELRTLRYMQSSAFGSSQYIYCSVANDIAILVDVTSQSSKWDFDNWETDIVSMWDSARKGRTDQMGAMSRFEGHRTSWMSTSLSIKQAKEKWDEICHRLQHPTYTMLEGNLLLAYVHPDLASLTKSCVYFTSNDGKVHTALKLSTPAAQAIDEKAYFREPNLKNKDAFNNGKITPWPKLVWDANEIPRTDKPLKLSLRAQELKEKKERAHKTFSLFAAAMAKSKWDTKKKCLDGFEQDRSERLRRFLTDCLNDGYRYIGVNRISNGLNVYPLGHFSPNVDICLSITKSNIQKVINKLSITK